MYAFAKWIIKACFEQIYEWITFVLYKYKRTNNKMFIYHSPSISEVHKFYEKGNFNCLFIGLFYVHMNIGFWISIIIVEISSYSGLLWRTCSIHMGIMICPKMIISIACLDILGTREMIAVVLISYWKWAWFITQEDYGTMQYDCSRDTYTSTVYCNLDSFNPQ